MKKSLFGASLIVGMMIASYAFAQLAGVERVNEHYWFLDDKQIRLGSLPNVACEYDTAQTPDALVCGLSAESNNFILTEFGDLGVDFSHAKQTNPTLFIHAADSSNTTKFVSLSHNGTNGLLDVGTGLVSIPDGISTEAITATVLNTGSVISTGAISGSSVTASGALSGASASVVSLTATGTVNFNGINVVSVSGDATGIDYNDVNKFELKQEDLGATCIANQIRFDTGGATQELCFCTAANNWACITVDSTAGVTD